MNEGLTEPIGKLGIFGTAAESRGSTADAARATAAVIGGGPAGLFAAEALATAGARVTVYDRMPSVGRKFLMAGRGGLNLTHTEDLAQFLRRYGAAADRLAGPIARFPPAALRAWCEELGQPTFVGSSGRVFPEALKASPLLRAWLAKLGRLGVAFALRQRWAGWDGAGNLAFEEELRARPEALRASTSVRADAVVLALGGASWPRLGSDGAWTGPLAAAGIRIAPLRPANGGFTVPWSDAFRTRFAGAPLKRISLTYEELTIRGEAVVTTSGVEGGAFYALSAPLREAILASGSARLALDLRPDLSLEALASRLARPRQRQSTATFLRKAAGLFPVAIGLLREAAGPDLPKAPAPLAALIKALPLSLTGLQPLERAISTAGGIALDEIDEHFMLRRRPSVFVAGEMLDWEAPTGGYLLQASFATGLAAANGALAWLAAHPPVRD